MNRVKIIGIEEHAWSPAIRDLLLALPLETQGVFYTETTRSRLSDFGRQRTDDLDAMGMDQQILSITTPGVQLFEAAHAVKLAREANNMLCEIVTENPERYAAAMATLAMPDPQAAADELERCVTELGFKGAMIHGRTDDKFIDHPDFAPILERAGALNMPIFIHPQRPTKHIADYYYMNGMPPMIGYMLSGGAWGWHMEAAINAIRLVVSGTFQRTPGLQIILGHWGEMIPFWLERIDEMIRYGDPSGPSFAETFKKHFYVAPSGLWSYPMLNHAVAVMGIDRILFAIDYPFIMPMKGEARKFLEEAPISSEDKEKIGHSNLEHLLQLVPHH